MESYHFSLWYMLWLPPLGCLLSIIGTMVGLGGGFILVPILLFLFPDASAGTISSISLTVVFLNAASATIGNVRAKRIDLRTAALLTVGAVPAAVLGAMASNLVDRHRFEILFGVMLVIGAAYIFWRARRVLPGQWAVEHVPNREIRERRGPVYRFYVSTLMAGIISPLGGFLSSFFGIGGGVIHVPAMTFILKMPARVVTATSLFVLVPTSLVGILTRVFSGEYTEGWRRAGLLGLGAIIGAQIGIAIGRRVNQQVIMVMLAVAMVLVGVRQILAGV